MSVERFYPVVDDVSWVRRFAPLGARFIQLRIKDKPDDEVRAQIAEAQAVSRAHGCALVVNDYWQVAIDLKCDWVHLGQEDLVDADVHAIRSAGLKIGISTHDEAELETALNVEPDYVALGPIYPTILKKMKWDPQGLDRIGEWKRRVGALPLVAIGGITLERAPGVYGAGANSIAVVTDLIAASDPEGRLQAWLEADFLV